MQLTLEQVLKLALKEVPKRILAMREESAELAVHCFGDRDAVASYLMDLTGYANERQKQLREELAISNAFLVEDLLRPADNVWSARGGSRRLGTSGDAANEKLRSSLAEAGKGLGLRAYMRDIWFTRMTVDPNGLIFVESDTQEAWLTFKSIHKIRDYAVNGYDLEWVCFEADYTDPDSGYKLMWVVDSAYYYRVKVTDGNASILEDLTVVNVFGKVPAVVNSGFSNTGKGYRDSLITKQVDLLKSYLNKNARKEIHQTFHDFPIAWEYESVCPTCRGTRRSGDGVCAACAGSGMSNKRDASTVRVLRNPTEETPGAPTPPAGYVQPELATMQAQRAELDWIFDKMFFSLWGATTEKAANETATGRFIDVQPVNNKLSIISDMAETVEKRLIDLFGAFYTPGLYNPQETVLLYGKRFLIETPDQIWSKYLQAKEKQAPEAALNLLLEQYYESEFMNDPFSLEYYAKLMRIEPFVHHSVSTVSTWQGASAADLAAKVYFQEWIDTVSRADVVSKTVEQNKLDLMNYANQRSSTGGGVETIT